MESVYGREFRVKKSVLFGMWYAGIGSIGAAVYILYLINDTSRLMQMLGSVVFAILLLALMWGVHQFAVALHWSFARVKMDDMGLTINSLSGPKRLDWINVTALDFLDKRAAISISSRDGEKLNLPVGIQDFPDVLRLILERIRANTFDTGFSNYFASSRFSAFTTFFALAALVAVILSSVLLTHDHVGPWLVAIGAIGVFAWQVTSGLKGVEIENNTVIIKYVWHTRRIPIDDITDVSVNIKNAGKKENASMVLTLGLVTSKKPVEIPFRGTEFLPLYFRLKQAVPQREP